MLGPYICFHLIHLASQLSVINYVTSDIVIWHVSLDTYFDLCIFNDCRFPKVTLID